MPGPVQAAQASQLIQMLAGAGGPPGGPAGAPPVPGGGAPPPTPEAAALGAATSQLDGANPQGISDMLTSMNTDLAKAYLTSATRVPNAAPHIAKARESLQKAIQEVQKAAQVLSTVRPIANTAGVGPGIVPPQGQQPDIAALLG